VSFLTTLNTIDKIQYVVDINPHRHGKFIPGVGKEIKSPEFLQDYAPARIIIMNAIYRPEIEEMLEKRNVKAEVIALGDELAQQLKMVANHGQSKRYYHDQIGVNSRLDAIQAAILRIKLRHLAEYVDARHKAAAFYDAAFADDSAITTPHRAQNSEHVFHQYTLKLHGVDRDGLMDHLQEKGIPANIYYPVPVHLQKGYSQYGYQEGSMPVTETLTHQVISLPMHTELTDEQLNHIVDTIKNYIHS